MQRGFGLISLLITLAIVAALSGVMLQGYFRTSMAPLLQDRSSESVRPDQSARLAEAQALLARTMMALTVCAQGKGLSGRSCSLADVAGSAGVAETGLTADGRWQVTSAYLSVGGNAKGLSVSLFATPEGAVTRCEASGDAPPSSPTSGQGC